MYILGVDGGGTKIEFMLASQEGQEILRFEFLENTNLKYVSQDKVIASLDKALNKIAEKVDLKDIKASYLGIAECGENCVGLGRDKILKFLESKLTNFELADDQYSVFRAKSPTPNGVLANAGTGSNINSFENGAEITYKSVGIGGRDFGKMILTDIFYREIEKNSEIYLAVEDFLTIKPDIFYKNLDSLRLISDESVPKIPSILISQTLDNRKLRQELKKYCILVACRWSQKIASFCHNYAHYNFDNDFDLVLSGSMWRWENMRNLMIEDLKRVFPNIQVFFDFDKKPVFGSVLLARERLA